MAIFLHMVDFEKLGGFVYRKLFRYLKEGSGYTASLSIGALRGELGGLVYWER